MTATASADLQPDRIATVSWLLRPFDYDLHGVASVGTPSFTTREFPYASEPVVTVTFTVAGPYLYEDPYYPGTTGRIVVR